MIKITIPQEFCYLKFAFTKKKMDLDIMAKVISSNSQLFNNPETDCVNCWEDPLLLNNPFNKAIQPYRENAKIALPVNNSKSCTFIYICGKCHRSKYHFHTTHGVVSAAPAQQNKETVTGKPECTQEHKDKVVEVCVDSNLDHLMSSYNIPVHKNWNALRYLYVRTVQCAENLIIHCFRDVVMDVLVYLEHQRNYEIINNYLENWPLLNPGFLSNHIFINLMGGGGRDPRVQNLEVPLNRWLRDPRTHNFQRLKCCEFYLKLLNVPAFYDKISSVISANKSLLRMYQSYLLEAN
jgi:hypothetical protein